MIYIALFDIKNTRSYILKNFEVYYYSRGSFNRISRIFTRSKLGHVCTQRIHCDLPLFEISKWNNGASRTALQKFTEFDYSIVSLSRRIWTQFYAGVGIFPSIFSFSHFVDGIYVTYTNSGYFGIIALQFSFRLARICRFSSTMKIKRNVKSEEI